MWINSKAISHFEVVTMHLQLEKKNEKEKRLIWKIGHVIAIYNGNLKIWKSRREDMITMFTMCLDDQRVNRPHNNNNE